MGQLICQVARFTYVVNFLELRYGEVRAEGRAGKREIGANVGIVREATPPPPTPRRAHRMPLRSSSRSACRELACPPRRRTSENSPSETVWKFSGTRQPPHHQADHCRVDERFCASTKPLVILAHPPVLREPGEGPFHHPPAG